METIEWTQSQVSDTFAGCRTFAEVIQNIESQYWARGYVICDVHLNGKTLSEGEEVTSGKLQAEAIEHLKIRLYRVGELLRDTRRAILDWIQRACPASETLAEKFRLNQMGEAQGKFSELVDGCEWLSQNVNLLRGLVDLDEMPQAEKNWLRNEERFVKTVKEINAAYEKKDYAMLADVIEYELTTSLMEWSQLLKNLPSLSDC